MDAVLSLEQIADIQHDHLLGQRQGVTLKRLGILALARLFQCRFTERLRNHNNQLAALE
ncbi:MAG: hypothetical protein JEY79_03515 [Pseudodesulfovibrio sp.]|nr:hypothetical protein [Pseudodesulfovibrio sp.]